MKKHKKPTKHAEYNALREISTEIYNIEGAARLLEWDQETYMPPGAAVHRGDVLTTLAGIAHKKHVGPVYRKALGKLIDIEKGKIVAKGLSEREQAGVRMWRRDFIKAKCLPQAFVEKWAQVTSTAINVWRLARKNNDFPSFLPHLKTIVDMSRKRCDYLGYEGHPYDALIDMYEPGATTAQITPLFTKLQKEIVPLLNTLAARKNADDSFLQGTWSHEKQLEFGKKVLEDMGYDFNRGRLDLSTHPFSSGSHPSDNRITTRFHDTSLINCVSVILHEGGHALYGMGLPEEEYGTPLGNAVSMAMHESQSRFWEIYIGQSKPFWSHYLPLLKKTFPGKLDKVTAEQCYKAINKVAPSFIRVDADEVTYPLHVILRYKLEKQLIEGSLNVKDVADAWNSGIVDLLGIAPKTDTEGCLQDIHWSMGGFGYFPTYTLGTMYAAQLFAAFKEEHPNWDQRIARGDLSFVKEWLHNKVHRYGRQYDSNTLIKMATGKSFDASAYTTYLKTKYL